MAVQVQVERRGSMVLARLEGEMDLESSPLLRQRLDDEIAAGGQHMILDMAGVTFLDSSGLGVILGRYRRIKEVGGDLAIAQPPPPIRRVLEVSGILSIVPVRGSGEAL